MNKQGSSIYDILVFAYADTRTADAVVEELKASQKLGGYKVVAEAVVIHEADGSVHIHEPGKGGRGAAIGAVAGGALALLGGPVGVLALAVTGGVIGGVAGHFAGREISADDLKKIGAQLPPNSSAFLALVEDTDAEVVVNSMKGYKANVVTVTLGDELSGTIAQAIAAEIQVPASQTGQSDKETPKQ